MKDKNEITLENLNGQHPYYEPIHCRSWTIGGHEFHIGFANGYNAGGLIGPEDNGIFILSKTDKRIVLDQHMELGCGHISGPHILQKHANEIERIIQLDVKGFSDFLNMSGRVRYNPFADALTEKSVKKQDMKLRLKMKEASFSDARFMTAKQKKKTLDQAEMFLRDRIFGGKEYARDRFPDSFYKMLSGCYGHIAHTSRTGFYHAQFAADDDLRDNLVMMSKCNTMYGFKAASGGYSDLEDLVKALSVIAKAYLPHHEPAVA